MTITSTVGGSVTLSNGSILTDITDPYEFTFNGLAAGYYTANFTAAVGGCTATTNFNILNTNSTLAATVAVENISCFGGTVTATVTATNGSAPYSYSLNGATAVGSGTFTGLVAGDYNVLVSDTNRCTYYVAFTIDQPTALFAEIITNNEVSCYGGSNGSATVNATDVPIM